MNEENQTPRGSPGRPRLRRGWLLLVAVAALAYWTSLPDESAGGDWPTGFRQALEAARSARRPLLVEFSAPNCPHCVRMKREVLGRRTVAEALDSFELVRVNPWEQDDLATRYRVLGVPVYAVLDPEGRLVARLEGYVPVSEFVSFLRRTAAAAGAPPAAS